MSDGPTPTCECCGQPLPPAKLKTLVASHRVETPGCDDAYFMRSGDAVDHAEQLWDSRGVRSNLFQYNRQRAEYLFWRGVPE